MSLDAFTATHEGVGELSVVMLRWLHSSCAPPTRRHSQVRVHDMFQKLLLHFVSEICMHIFAVSVKCEIRREDFNR